MKDDSVPPAKSWRAVLRVHPAAEMFPLMTESEFKILCEDIEKHDDIREPVAIWKDQLLDGRNRLDAIEAVGLPIFDEALGSGELLVLARDVSDQDPYDYVISANMARRHLTLTNEQRRDLIAKILKAKPETSNRAIAAQARVDDKTVAGVRARMESTAEIPQLKKTVGKDGKARTASPKKGARGAFADP